MNRTARVTALPVRSKPGPESAPQPLAAAPKATTPPVMPVPRAIPRAAIYWRRYRLSALFALAALIVVGTALVSELGMREYQESNAWVERTLEIDRLIERLDASANRAESRHALARLHGDPEQRAAWRAQAAEVDVVMTRLEALVVDAGQRQRLRETRTMLPGWRRALEASESGDATAVVEERLTAQVTQLHLMIGAIRDAQRLLLIERRARMNQVADRLRSLQIGGVALTLVLLAAALAIVVREQRRRAGAERDLKTSLAEAKGLADQLRQLSELGEMLQSCRSAAEAMETIALGVPGILSGSAGSVFLFDAARAQLARAGGWGRHRVGSDAEFEPDRCWAIRRSQIYPTSDGHQACCAHLHCDGVVDHHYHCIPLGAHGESLGVLYVEAAAAPTRAQRRLARAVAEQLSLAIANLRLQDSLRTQSIRDALTGLFNRRYLDASLERELARAERRSQPLALMILDVDFFKRINDSYGHEAGDAVLAQIGEVLRANSRAEDVCCRYGGEEFVVILPEADLVAAQRRAEELRTRIAAADVAYRGRSLGRITASIGVAAAPLHGRSATALRTAADQALYEAKRGGRNRVVVAG